jgi:hypothetical protein
MTAARERIGLLDVAIAVVISALSVVYVWHQAATDSRDVSAVAAPLAVAITLPFCGAAPRRSSRWPPRSSRS